MSDESGARRQKILLGVSVVLLIAAGVLAWARLGGASIYNIAAERAFICVETDKVFEYTIKEGDKSPYPSPHTGRNTGYPADTCYWTKDASGRWDRKEKPTFVLVKKTVDPKTDEKTYCPDCGRLVVRHNPPPTDDQIAKANAGAGY
ncbi:MAG: hypothetical protein MI923_13875 [Phycisphaerales bacterium]|nr:hypothetical protein [Phycisphaerales bacterium]